MQKQHSIGICNLGPCTLNAYLFNLINALAFAQPRCVNDVNWHAFNLNGLLHHIARGAGNGRHDGQLCACQSIEQRAFAGIGLASNDHAYAFTQQSALLGLLHHACKVVFQTRKLSSCIGLLQKINFFFWKIKRRLHQSTQVD